MKKPEVLTEEKIYNQMCELLPKYLDPRPKSQAAGVSAIEAILRVCSRREFQIRNELATKLELGPAGSGKAAGLGANG